MRIHALTIGPDYSAAFHLYGVLWTPTGITWYIDNVPVFSTSSYIPTSGNGFPGMYIILNNATGGSWGGPPDATTVFPNQLEIDYVRVYTQGTTVTASAGANGSISPSGSVAASNGSTMQFTVMPNSGYTASVGGTCGGTLSGNTYTTNPITTSCTVSASFAANTYTVTSSAGSNGSISPMGSVTASSGSTKQFTVTPNTGYTASVGGTCGGTLSGNTYTTNPITTNCSVSATFAAANTYTITASAGSNGAISPSGSCSANLRVEQNLCNCTGCRLPGSRCAGRRHLGWSSHQLYLFQYHHQPYSLGNFYTQRCNSRITHIITASAGSNGSITPAGSVTASSGSTKQFTVTPDSGYTASVGGTCGGTLSGNTYTTNPTTVNCTVSAAFAPVTAYTISATVKGSGSISPSGAVNVPTGSNKAFIITPAAYYRVSGVTVDGKSVGAVSSYIFTNVNANHTIEATFTRSRWRR